MPPRLALFGGVLFVIWLFALERKRYGKAIWVWWLPVIWLVLASTRTPDGWHSVLSGDASAAKDGFLGTLVYGGIFLVSGWVVVRQNLSLQTFVARNGWLFVLYFYMGSSVIWSDQPASSFKLWIKDAGNVLMVLILLGAKSPDLAMKRMLLRTAYILVILSFVVVKYFPEVGRAYDKWTYQPIIIGASTDKNGLGASLIICTIGIFWDIIDIAKNRSVNRLGLMANAVVMAMALWLLVKSRCATALACSVIGCLVMLAMQSARIRLLVGRLGMSIVVVIPAAIVVLDFMFGISSSVLGVLGRDSTLTGRSGIWEASLRESVDTLIGAGYCSFWYGARADSIAESLGFFFELREAHNGYLETYLNLGLVGLCMLGVVLLKSVAKLCRTVPEVSSAYSVRFALLLVALAYNVTESAFSGLSPIWFALLLITIRPPLAIKASQAAALQFPVSGQTRAP